MVNRKSSIPCKVVTTIRGAMDRLPDKMTGKDLRVQEEYEAQVERNFFDSLDKVERRDKQDHIVSASFNRRGRDNYDNIVWD